MAYVEDFMLCYAPTVNSYKRFREASWAPTRLAWSQDNRTAGFRVVGEGPSSRIECRIPGADCNPYLVYAAALASGLEGIERRIEPPPMFTGDVYSASDLPRVPSTLDQALAHFRASDIAARAFGTRRGRTLQPLRRGRDRGVPERRSPTGNAAATSNRSELSTRGGHYLSAVSANPAMNGFWSARKTIAGGIETMRAASIRGP